MSEAPDIHLVKAIADLAIFLEFSGDSVLDEDSGVEALEQLATELKLMPDDTKAAFCAQLEAVSASYNDAILRTFVADLPETLGLIEED